MKNYGCFVAAVLGVVFAVSYATINGNYSVNVHFIPALVRGPCPFGQLWNPPNITCASCYCLTGQLSRCGPRPGCNPTANATATTTTTPTPPEGAMTTDMPMVTQPTPMQNQNPTTQSSVNPPATGTGASSAPPSSAASAAPTSAPASSAGTAASAATEAAATTPAPAATTMATKFRRGSRR